MIDVHLQKAAVTPQATADIAAEASNGLIAARESAWACQDREVGEGEGKSHLEL